MKSYDDNDRNRGSNRILYSLLGLSLLLFSSADAQERVPVNSADKEEDLGVQSAQRSLIYRTDIPNDGAAPLPPSTVLVRHGVTFNIWYLDDVEFNDTEIGFDDPIDGIVRRARLEEALGYIALILNEDGELDVVVRESANDGPGGDMEAKLAEAGTWHAALDNWQNGVTYERLALGLAKPFGPFVDDLHVRVDFGFEWNSRIALPGIDEFDLKSVLIHEICHTLGIASASDGAGVSQLDIDGDGDPDAGYTWWDYFIVDSAGAPLFDCCPPMFLGSGDWSAGNIYWSGPEAVAQFGPGGLGPKLIGPSGDAPSHWDKVEVPGAVMITDRFPHFTMRTLKAFEVGCASHLIDRVVFMRLHSTRIGDEVHLPEATQPV